MDIQELISQGITLFKEKNIKKLLISSMKR